MGREILFKAKRIDNGEWVEGYLFFIVDTPYIICDGEEICMDGENTDLYATEWYTVDENTICQYTGLTDKNGNKIWENDFVELNEDVKKIFDVENGQVRYYSGTFIIGGKNELSGSLFAIADIFGVLRGSTVGNIFDNPELLEGGE